MIRLFAKRAFSSSSGDLHFLVEKLDKGVVVFKMNRPRQRNAISMKFVD